MMLISVSTAGPTPVADDPPLIDATHVPPVLTVPGEPIRLRYGLVCTPRADGLPCDGSGTVYLRAGQSGPFHPFALQRGDASKDGRYYVDVPRDIAASPEGFSYYAVLRDDATGAAVSVPSGGADAPQVSLPMYEPIAVTLGRHVFGAVRAPDERVAAGAWGSEPDEVGLAGSRELGFTGPSSFDVEPDGTVDMLDSVNGRVVRWGRGRRDHVPISGALELADFAAEPDGSFDVLADDTLRHLRADGTQKWAQKLAERTWAKLAHGANVLQQPSEQWMPVSDGGAPLTRPEQRRGGHAAHLGVLVERVGEAELRVAVLRGKAPLRSWRITSETPLGEVQTAEPHGNGIVVITRAYTDDRDEFVVLVLGPDGLVQRFSVESGSWTETAPLARFRLARGRLYRLRTTEAGAFVDRFDLEVPQ
ncbi:MAG: hypothetical protein AUG91_02815 [Actinobacteria bacterium 13_1_20CM_4_69_9]|nr:MAG: hypothetical protein AUG91_02815 [Actinobacteria bacterium 13_1_20CM_4_69_9]